MEEPKHGIDEQILANLSSALSRITDLVDKTLKEDRYYPGFREDMLDIRKRVDRVVHVLHEGNGERPLVTRMSLAEAALENIRDDIHELKDIISNNKLTAAADSAAVVSSKITTKGYVGVGVISGITAIIVGIIQKLL